MRPNAKTLLSAASLPSYLTTDPISIRYITGVTMTSGMLLVRPRGYVLFADGRYSEAARQQCAPDVTVKESELIDAVMKTVSRCGFPENEITVGTLRRWKRRFSHTTFVPSSDSIRQFRRTKDAREMRLLKRALAVTNAMLQRVPAALRAGIREQELAWKLECWARELGAEKLSFEPIVAFGTHTSRPHHRPTQRKLARGNIVQIDVGAVVGGYCADRSEVFFTAAPTSRQLRVLQAVTEAKKRAIAACRAGASVRQLDADTREFLKQKGLSQYFTHSLGHGVGLDIHEGVTLSQRGPDEHLRPGEVVTIEPGVYIPGSFGIRLEDMVFVR